MSEAPVTFTDDQVLAVLAGRKTQARFPIKLQPSGPGYICEKTPKYRNDNPNAGRFPGHRWAFNREAGGFWGVNFDCPWGLAGDQLWVRERIGTDMADGIGMVWNHCVRPSSGLKRWQGKEPERLNEIPADQMPRWASRISLDLVDVRVQLLQDITCGGYLFRSEVRLEGCPFSNDPATLGADEMEWFKPQWDARHAEAGHGWESNPWVWVLDFNLKGGE